MAAASSPSASAPVHPSTPLAMTGDPKPEAKVLGGITNAHAPEFRYRRECATRS